MARRSTLRAADSDRESVAEHLRRAAGEGRLCTEELEDRIGAALSARTYGQLDALVSDLPRAGESSPRRRPRRLLVPRRIALLLAIPLAIAIVASVVLAITGVLAMWWVWAIVGWVWLGRCRRRRLGPWGNHGRWGGYRFSGGRGPGAYGPRQTRLGAHGWDAWDAGRAAARRSREFWA